VALAGLVIPELAPVVGELLVVQVRELAVLGEAAQAGATAARPRAFMSTVLILQADGGRAGALKSPRITTLWISMVAVASTTPRKAGVSQAMFGSAGVVGQLGHRHRAVGQPPRKPVSSSPRAP
jgi:hypothetical protein